MESVNDVFAGRDRLVPGDCSVAAGARRLRFATPALAPVDAARILIVNDHPLVSQAAAGILGSLSTRTEVVGVETVARALDDLAAHPDTAIVLLDPGLPAGPGATALLRLRAAHPGIPMIAFSAARDRADALAALAGGAMGFLPERSPPGCLVDAVRRVLAGEIYMPPGILSGGNIVAARAPAAGHRVERLTPRQLEVLALLVRGKPNKLIGRELGLADGTVKTHIATIFRLLGVNNRTQAGFAVNRIGIALPGAATRSA